MARTVSLLLSAQHSADLQGVIEDRGRPVKHVQRAKIVLLPAARLPVLEIAKRVGISRPMVWRWQQRFERCELTALVGSGKHYARKLTCSDTSKSRRPAC